MNLPGKEPSRLVKLLSVATTAVVIYPPLRSKSRQLNLAAFIRNQRPLEQESGADYKCQANYECNYEYRRCRIPENECSHRLHYHTISSGIAVMNDPDQSLM